MVEKEGEMHRCLPPPGGQRCLVFSHPKTYAMQAADNLKKPVRLGALSMAKVISALLEGPCSVPELMGLSGLSANTVHEYMRALRKEGVVHIGAWEKDATGRESLRIFKFGPGKDVARRKKSKALIAKECRQRKKAAQRVDPSTVCDGQDVSFFWPTGAEATPILKTRAPLGANVHWSGHRLR